MNDPEYGLSLPVVQDWPGSGTATVGYGSVGALIWDAQGEPVFARQKSQQRLINQKTRQLAPPVQPSHCFKDYPNSDIRNTHTFLSSLGAAGIPEDILIAETYDTANTTGPCVYDPQAGQRIYEVDPYSKTLAFADDTYVFLIDDNDSIARTIDVCSPVLQLDKFGLVRTRRGLATIDADGGVDYMREGFFMHATSKGEHGEEVIATSTGGTIMLFDVETKTRKWKQTMSRGSMSRWSRVVGLENPATILWCNRYEMALIDLRMKPRPRQKALAILDYSDRLSEIRDVDAGFNRGDDVFAVTSNDLLWISATSSKPMHPVLSSKHMLSEEDVSVNLYRGSYAGNDLLTISSQISSQTVAGTFARTEGGGLPVSTHDMYFVQAWPTIVPQSHITRETPDGAAMYSVGRDGGLYKQTWVKADSAEDEVVDLPGPDAATAPVSAPAVLPANESHNDKNIRDYNLFETYEALKLHHFQWLYRWAYKWLEEIQEEFDIESYEPRADEKRGAEDFNAQSEFWTSDVLRDHLERAWLDPLEDKSETRDVHPRALDVRRHTIDRILHEALQSSRATEACYEDVNKAADDIQLASEFASVLEQWQLHGDEPDEEMLWEAASQPTQMHHSSQGSHAQPMGYAGSFSQPTPGLPSLKVSKKRRGDKKSSKKKKMRH